MNEALRQLADLTGWRGTATYSSTDWVASERGLGLELPFDYKELLSAFPPGTYFAPNLHAGSVVVHPPLPYLDTPDHLHQFTTELDELREWRRDHPGDVPRPVFPEAGGMVPWARSGGNELLLWVREPGRSPDEWTVAVTNQGIWRPDDSNPVVEEFACSATEFLVGVVSGAITSEVLARDMRELASLPPLPRRQPFLPLTEEEWNSED